MKATYRRALMAVGTLVASFGGGALASLDAQQVCRVAPPDDVKRIMVPALRSSNKQLAVQAADEIRERLGRDFSCRDLLVISKNDIERTLVASGYRTDTALSPTDAKTLATLMRADEYISGSVVRTPENEFQVEANLVLSRNNALVQPLPTVRTRRLDDAAKEVARHLDAAKKQMAAEQRCVALARQNNYVGAAAAAQQGIQAYPQSTLARLCLLEMYSQLNYGADSLVRVAEEILAIDPRSRIALEYAAVAYDSLKQDDKAVDAWTRLIAADPTNTRLVERATAYLLTSGQAARARPIIMEAVEQNPGDPALQRLKFLVLLTIRDWRAAYETGEELIKTDTAMADTTFFTRLVSAYANDSQPQRAAEAAARGIAKFPSNASLYALHAQTLRNAGQLQQSLVSARRAVELNPRIPRGWVLVAQTQMDLGQPDSSLASLRRAKEMNTDSTFLSQYALSLGNQAFRDANAMKDSASASATRAKFQQAVRFLALADSVADVQQNKDNANFLLGISAFALGQSAATDAPRTKSCELARTAQDAFTLAQIHLPRGASVNQQAAGQYMQYLSQFTPVVDRQVRQFCR